MGRESIYVVWAVLVALAIPLGLRLVGPNGFYGFRTGKTLADPDLWFRVNGFFGLTLIAAVVVSVLILRFAPGSSASLPQWAWLMAMVGPALVALALTLAYIGAVSKVA